MNPARIGLGILHGDQFEITREAWPVLRPHLVKELEAREELIRTIGADEPLMAARANEEAWQYRTAIAKHDERYAQTKPSQDKQILAPKVGLGLIGHNRHHVVVDVSQHPEERFK